MAPGRALTWAGATGTLLGLLCCFTPLLPFLLAATGSSALLSILYQDAVLIPFVVLSMVVMCVGVLKMRGRSKNV
ncbi:hypothetical protein C1J03_20745 [Sulfitobacter sp. SK012]|nr:hypothetical protein C1J03_20745 [Sulfitobacter sp. SK012]